ncbi:MAG: hypothetical protein ACPGQS_12470 [Bradymonadia bacterium]
MRKGFYYSIPWVLVVLLTGMGSAQESTKRAPESTVLKQLFFGETWGAGKDGMLAVIKETFDNVWRAEAAQMDAFEVDQQIRKSQERFQAVVSSYSELDQSGVEFLASPLKGQFGLGLDQSVLRVPLSDGDRYFLFQEARLAKFVEVVPASRFKDFNAFIKNQLKRLKVRSLTVCTEEQAGEPEDNDSKHLFDSCVINRTRLYNAFLLVVTDPKVSWRVKKESEMPNDDLAGLPDIFSEDPTAEDNQHLVDELTGASKKKSAKPTRSVPSQKNVKSKSGTKKAKKATRKSEKGLYEDQDVLY